MPGSSGSGGGVVGEVARDELLDAVEEALAQVVAVEQLQLAEHLDQVVRPALVLRDERRYLRVDRLAQRLEQRELRRELILTAPVAEHEPHSSPAEHQAHSRPLDSRMYVHVHTYMTCIDREYSLEKAKSLVVSTLR